MPSEGLRFTLSVAGIVEMATAVVVEDGIFGKNTYDAVKIFQRYNGLNDDGIVGPQTWRKLGVPELLTRSSSGSPASPSSGPSRSPSADSNGTVAETGDGFCFPFPALPARSWTNGGRQFGASRSGGRRHAGCDLIFPRGTLIYAVADGILVQPPYPFYEGTSAVEIRHGNLLLRYGEIINGSYVGGQTVQKGQVIAKVGRLHSGSSCCIWRFIRMRPYRVTLQIATERLIKDVLM